MAGSVTVVMVMTNISADVARVVLDIRAKIGTDNTNIILIDCGSEDGTIDAVETLLLTVPDLEYIGLSQAGTVDDAYLAGMEHAPPGEVLVLFDPLTDSVDMLPQVVEGVRAGHDLVVVSHEPHRADGMAYRLLSWIFVASFRAIFKLDLRASASRFRGMSTRVAAHITRHEGAAIGYQVIPFLTRFRRMHLHQSQAAAVAGNESVTLLGGIRKAVGLVVGISALPLRLTGAICLMGAACALLSSTYVVVTYLMVDGIAPGWTTLSLQMNGMFFLLSIALAMLSEYVLTIKAAGKPPYHIVRSLRSTSMSRTARLNVLQGAEDEAS